MVNYDSRRSKTTIKNEALSVLRESDIPLPRDIIAKMINVKAPTLAGYINELIAERVVVLDHKNLKGLKFYRAGNPPPERYSARHILTTDWKKL